MAPSATIASVGEEGLIARLRRRLGALSPPSPAGMGDDAARLRHGRRVALLWSTDLLVEDVHFRRAQAPPRLLGRKVLAINCSDLAAMGAASRAFLLGLSLPPSLPLAWFDAFVQGLVQGAREFGTICSGGDTCASRDAIAVTVAVAGEAPPRRLLTRGAARPGDGLWVSGPLGAAAVGLRLLDAGWRLEGRRAVRRGACRADERRMAGRALRAQLDPHPPLGLGPWLARRGVSRAAIDLSDGLSRDLERLCRASGVGARVDAGALPLDPAALFWEPRRGADPRQVALHGGEDYALLFTVPPGRETMLEALPRSRGLRPARIGRIVAAREIQLVEPAGGVRTLRPDGFHHFGRDTRRPASPPRIGIGPVAESRGP